jgi:putative membrane protein
MDDAAAKGRDAFSETRAESASHRTLLAEQRTYSAWVRTALASTATGFGIARLMAESGPAWLIRSLAALFVLAGASMFLLAFWAYRDAVSKVNEIPASGVPLWILAILTLILFIAAIIGLYLIFRPL